MMIFQLIRCIIIVRHRLTKLSMMTINNRRHWGLVCEQDMRLNIAYEPQFSKEGGLVISLLGIGY
jgi:hypothetical protein